MGIPKFFRWLTRRYPMILQNIQREEDCPPTDNLYMDLNSIVHNCIHGNDAKRHERISKLADLEEVWADIMRAIDEIVHVVKPRKMILLALDGVAPRAKMNQQRARRFRAAKDSLDLRETLKAQGKEVPELFDSNQISPGTNFMYELGKQLEWFVKFKLNTDPIYQQCERVNLTDSSVPGEGEHKMMDYIRNLKLEKGYDPNTRHCFYGSDADLIMLSLLTHEPHFMIIREEHVIKKLKHGGVQRIDISRTNNLQLIHIAVLREYFLVEYRDLAGSMKIRFDLERIIDDFVFFCFFIGNDFLPALSALDISEGSLDHLINFYKKYLPEMTDYITDAGLIHWDRAEPFIALLGKYEHQVFINRVKTLDSRYENSKSMVHMDDSVRLQKWEMSKSDQASLVQSRIKKRIYEKKVEKCKNLFLKNRQKGYKKALLLKKFAEDYEETMQEKDNMKQQDEYNQAMSKYRKKKYEQFQGDNKLIEDAENSQAKSSLHEVISELREEYISDLNAEEIPNSDISELDESEFNEENQQMIEATQLEEGETLKVELAQATSEKYIEQNHEFMKIFTQQYKEDANGAKRSYYQQKLKFDVNTPPGKRDLHKLLFTYLEGMQWVLFYYYKGAQHWRWYYPYHYAPMISDLGSNIVQDFLQGQKTITEFKTDTHCNANKMPYTPFQQLLCIFPVKSLKAFLPSQYADLAQSELTEYFPDTFDIDLNGRTLPWEAAILIPFADEELFIEAEAKLFEGGLTLSTKEGERNTVTFVFPSYHLDWDAYRNDKKNGVAPTALPSLLGGMNALKDDYSRKNTHQEYQQCGQHAFSNKLLEGVACPCPDFPSMNWLNVISFDMIDKFINKVQFKQCLAQIPSTKEDLSGAEFETWIYKFAQSQRNELYVGFPFQIEAFPRFFEDPYSVYEMTFDQQGKLAVRKLRQSKSEEEFKMECKRIGTVLESEGIQVGREFNTLVTLCKVVGTDYDEVHDTTQKLYSEVSITVPFNLCMRNRSAHHYLNVNERVNTVLGRIVNKQAAVCFNPGLLGVIGTVKGRDAKTNNIKLEIDKINEEAKIHNPFLAENLLKKELQGIKYTKNSKSKPKEVGADEDFGGDEENKSSLVEQDQDIGTQIDSSASKPVQLGQYYGDQEIEVQLRLRPGVINKLTSSFLIAYDQIGKDERQVVDIGLNIKNFTKKVHIPDYVRFVAPHTAGSSLLDDYNHNQHSRGARHVRKHWEYSAECFDIIRLYQKKFPEVFDAVYKTMKGKGAMKSLFDLYPELTKKEKDKAISNLREITDWIEKLPLSNLPYVEMGFDALDTDLIQKLQHHNQHVLANYNTIELQVKPLEYIGVANVYQENYPYWFGPYYEKPRVDRFRVGNRVMNLNSSLRSYIPFGLRGTVVGKTESKVIVMFDEQFLNGNNIYGHCQNYKGAQILPEYLLNLTQTFATIPREERFAIKKFSEKPLEGQAQYSDPKANQDSAEVSKREQFMREKQVQEAAKEALEPKKKESDGRKKPPQKPQGKNRDDQSQQQAKKQEEGQVPNPQTAPGLNANAREFKPKSAKPQAPKQQMMFKPKENQISSAASVAQIDTKPAQELNKNHQYEEQKQSISPNDAKQQPGTTESVQQPNQVSQEQSQAEPPVGFVPAAQAEPKAFGQQAMFSALPGLQVLDATLRKNLSQTSPAPSQSDKKEGDQN